VEYWNIGNMSFAGLANWANGIIGWTSRLKMKNIPQQTHDSINPRFHYSMVEA